MIRPIVLLLFLFIYHVAYIEPIEITFERVEMMNSTYLKGHYNVSMLRISKFNRTFLLTLMIVSKWKWNFITVVNLIVRIK